MISRFKAPAFRRWLALSLTLVVIAALSPAALAATVPGAPTGLVATPGNGQVALTWVAPADDGGSPLTDYRLQYKKSTAISWTTYPDGVSLNTFGTVPLLTNGTSYDFRVRARNAIGFSDPSNVVSATPTAANPGAPGIPANLAASPGDKQVVLTWDAPTDGGSPITDYGVQQRTIGGTWHTFPDGTSTATTATVTLLVNLTTYEFRVRARNAVGWGTWSPPITSTPTAPTVPTKPLNLAATALDKQVALTWDPPASDGGSAITDYRVQYKKSTAITWTTFPDGTSTNLFATVTLLVNGTSYDFRVRAINAIGLGAASDAVSTIPAIPVTPPGVPQNLAAAAGDEQATLTWIPPANDGGSPILDYAIQYRTGLGSWTLIDPAASGLVVGGLTNGEPYEFQVRARNAIGSGAWSASVFATPMTVPGIPLNLAAAAGDQQATLTWDPPADDGGSAIIDYAYQYREAAGPGAWSAIFTPAVSGLVVSGLDNGTEYDFRVRARNGVGSSTWSDPVSATPMTLPGIPLNLAAAPGPAQATLTWDPPADDGGSAIIDYAVQYRTGLGAWTLVNPAASGVIVTPLTNGLSYEFQVRARNAVGSGDWSASAFAIPTAPATPPSAPRNVNHTPGNGQIALTWLIPLDDGGAPITDYVIEYRYCEWTDWWGNCQSWSSYVVFADGTSANLFATLTGLDNGTMYGFRVAAVNSAGPGDWSSVHSDTPFCIGCPNTPYSFEVDWDDANQVQLDWRISTPPSVTQYQVRYCLSDQYGNCLSDWGWTTISTGSTSSDYLVTGLTPNTWYTFWVRAVNATGASPWTYSISERTD